MKKCKKIYATVVFVVAVVLAYLVMQQSFDASRIIIPISKFIEVLIPVLGVGALVKYIACGTKCPCCESKDGSCGK